MQDTEKTCGNCGNWRPPKTNYSKLGGCIYLPKGVEKYPEERCISWCWKRATPEQIASRVKAGLIEGE